jgi:cytidylate kinase
MSKNIAIDGPAGAGKSTIAKLLSQKLGYIYIDTGAMYRAFGYYFLKNNIDPSDEASITAACPDVNITITYEGGEQQVILNGENVNGVIRTEEVGNMASATSVYPVVRKKLVELQRRLASKADVIMDGRDIGTCVLPDAEVKIYLTASSATRAKRRYDELVKKGVSCDIDDIQRDIEERDYRDMHREASPLKQADDAIVVDSSSLTIDEVVETIYDIAVSR